GFDASLTNFEGLGPKLLPLTLKPGQDKPGRIWADAERLGSGYEWMLRSKITGGFVDAAIGFIEKAGKDRKPFYVNLWPDDVHSPFWPPVDKWGNGEKRTLYHGVLRAMDEQLGVLFDYIRNSRKLRSNTLILVCSDNGPEKGAGSAGPFRGFKTMLYEGGIRSPLVVWGPGLIEAGKAGAVNRTSVMAAIDLVPSLLALAAVEPPDDVAFDGQNLAEVLTGKTEASRAGSLFFSRPPDRRSFYGVKNLPDLAVRNGRWKLLCSYDGSSPQLYDLDADRGETKNVARGYPQAVRRLSAEVVSWHESMPPDSG
ncbi:MAG: sulfatase-like hydrolase/transferase, partial [Phycisphaerales bacterium]